MVKGKPTVAIEKAKIKRDKTKIQHREIANKMLETAQKDLIPNMQNKIKQISKLLEELVGNDMGLVTTQIELIIGNRSMYELASASIQKIYTAEELMIGLELYREIIAKINEKIVYPPSVFTFCSFMGMSTVTYKNYKSDPDKAEVMQMIDDYIAGIQFTSTQIGKLKEIITIFGLKSIHGFYEATAPITIKKEVKVDIDEISKQVKALSKRNVIDAEFEEK